MLLYWTLRDELVMIAGVAMKGKWVIIPAILSPKTLDELHSNHMGIEKTSFLAKDSVHWKNMNNRYGKH